MTTPFVMLAILMTPLLVAWRLRTVNLEISYDAAGVIGLVMLLLFTASGHFIETQAMADMLPPFVPLVYLTGIFEILLALGIALPAMRRVAGLAAIATLVLFFSANVYAAFNRVEMGGHAWGPAYLLIRAPLQALLIAWTWWFTMRAPVETRTEHPVSVTTAAS